MIIFLDFSALDIDFSIEKTGVVSSLFLLSSPICLIALSLLLQAEWESHILSLVHSLPLL